MFVNSSSLLKSRSILIETEDIYIPIYDWFYFR